MPSRLPERLSPRLPRHKTICPKNYFQTCVLYLFSGEKYAIIATARVTAERAESGGFSDGSIGTGHKRADRDRGRQRGRHVPREAAHAVSGNHRAGMRAGHGRGRTCRRTALAVFAVGRQAGNCWLGTDCGVPDHRRNARLLAEPGGGAGQARQVLPALDCAVRKRCRQAQTRESQCSTRPGSGGERARARTATKSRGVGWRRCRCTICPPPGRDTGSWTDSSSPRCSCA